MKRYYVTAKFPQALCKHTFQSVTVEASRIPHALKLAMNNLLQREGVKGLRHKVIQVTIQPDFAAKEESTNGTNHVDHAR